MMQRIKAQAYNWAWWLLRNNDLIFHGENPMFTLVFIIFIVLNVYLAFVCAPINVKPHYHMVGKLSWVGWKLQFPTFLGSTADTNLTYSLTRD